MPPPNTPTNGLVDVQLDVVLPNPPTGNYTISPRVTYQQDRQLEQSDETVSPDSNLNQKLDLRALTYINPVDENLICPICHVALIDPVDTLCDHTFCRECITHALAITESCPIDRYPLPPKETLTRSHKIIINQLDSLQVKCPCCDNAIPRAMLQNHVDRYCKDALVKCPRKSCVEVIRRKFFEKGCLHYDSTCPDCQERHQEIEMDDHRLHSCKERHGECNHCGAVILNCQKSRHLEECPSAVASCKWAEYGCQMKTRRKDLQFHDDECAFKTVGAIAEILKREISTLRSEIQTLTEKDKLQERRIKFLENGLKDTDRAPVFTDISTQSISSLPGPADAEPPTSTTTQEYLLSLVESQESKIDQLSAGMTELEAKQTMMLFNETIPIKDQLAELRSSQSVVGMHVRWLMNFRLQENQRKPLGGSGGGPGPGSSGGSDSGSPSSATLPRRLSDSTRELATKL
ncbi:hypothetical protein B7494_g2306 [Chlorociboria aeruginascens]|nr:hypothetical protein B7494_g2306 [Chlorociboria aeruginascens]